MKAILWLVLILAGVGSVGAALLSGKSFDMMLAAIFGVSFTVAAAALAIIGAVENIGKPPVKSGVPDEI